ncbi:MAG: 50S ribosomal protein L3 [Candidatus Dependentiae bacterium]
MSTKFWGKKIGMTQVFLGDKVVPVTAVDLSAWVVTQIKTKERDGYEAVQVGCLRERFKNDSFKEDWVKKPKKYFSHLKEMSVESQFDSIQIGQLVNFTQLIETGTKVNVVGTTKGGGFAGVVKRHGFAGGRASHGSKMGNKPGSSGFFRRQGRIIKGKKFPGHMGMLTKMMKGLEVIKVEPDNNIVLVKGSVPGKTGSLLCIKKA